MNEQTSNSCESVTMVVPARDAVATIEHCLLAARDIQMQPDSPLTRIILVNDGSRDATAEIARKLGIEVINGTGRGAAAARNMGWLAATTDLIWFIDADCIPDPNSLTTLLPHLRHAEWSVRRKAVQALARHRASHGEAPLNYFKSNLRVRITLCFLLWF